MRALLLDTIDEFGPVAAHQVARDLERLGPKPRSTNSV